MLHYFLDLVMRAYCKSKSQSEQGDIEFTFSTVSRIAILLHYLSCMWIHIGSAVYLEYEPGYLPW